MNGIYLELALCYFKIPHVFKKPTTYSLRLRVLYYHLERELFKKMNEKMFDIFMNGDGQNNQNKLIGLSGIDKLFYIDSNTTL